MRRHDRLIDAADTYLRARAATRWCIFWSCFIVIAYAIILWQVWLT